MAAFGNGITQYHPEHLNQVVELMRYLWGDDYNANMSHFKWKYEENPYIKYPLGVVALDKGNVVGFRGYLATRWQLQEKGSEFMVLSPGDTCVHPDHRKKGLSVAMGKMASDEYASKYWVFLNLTANQASVPGYLKMGFVPLCDKKNWERFSMIGLIRSLFSQDKSAESSRRRIAFGEFGKILVSEEPRPREMRDLIARQNYTQGKITLVQDEDFFEWRFKNKLNKYIFLYHREDNITQGYVVIGVSKDNSRGYILDYTENDLAAIEEILRWMIRMKYFDVISINDFSISNDFSQVLMRLGFKVSGLVQTTKRRLRGVLPVLLRPVKRDHGESDWFIEGLDLRQVGSWKLKGICSDAA